MASHQASNTREVKLIAIGNSRGIRLPKELLDKYGWGERLVLEELEEGHSPAGKRDVAPVLGGDVPRHGRRVRRLERSRHSRRRRRGLMADFPHRYEIYVADLNPTLGGEIRKVRPVVVVSRDEMNRFLDTVVVCPLTTRLHPRWRGRPPGALCRRGCRDRRRPDPRHQQAAPRTPDRPSLLS